MKKLIGLTLFLTLILTNAFASIPVSRTWQFCGFGGGGHYTIATFDRTEAGRTYMTSDVAGQWYSTDYGDNWIFANEGATSENQASWAQSETDPDQIWILGKNLMKSTDRGVTWTKKADYVGTRSDNYKGIAIDRNNANIVYVGGDNGIIYKTTDGGDNWSTYATAFNSGTTTITFLYINKASTRLFAGSVNQGLKIYNLSNDTVSTVHLTGTNADYTEDFTTYTISGTEYLCITAGLKVAITSNDGSSWSYSTAIGVDATKFLLRIAAKRTSGGQTNFVASYMTINNYYSGGGLYSHDGGTTWAAVTIHEDSDMSPTRVWKVGSNPATGLNYSYTDDDKVFWTDDWGCFRSDDGGVNFYEKVNGAGQTVIEDIAISPNDRIFICGMDVGVLYSDDQGDTWTAAVPNATTGLAAGGHYWQVEVLGTREEWDNNQGVVVATCNWWTDLRPRVARSADNGVTWSFITAGLPNHYPYSGMWGIGYFRQLAKLSTNDNILYAGMDGSNEDLVNGGGVWKSTDRGATWARTTTQPDYFANMYKAMDVNPLYTDGSEVAIGTFAYQSRTTTDGGVTWSNGLGPNYSYSLKYASNGKAYITGTNGTLYESTRPFAYVSFPTLIHTFGGVETGISAGCLMEGLLPDPNDPNRLFIGTGFPDVTSRIYVTDNLDQGASATWTEITGDFPAVAGASAFAINYTEGDQGFLYAANRGGCLFKLDLKDTEDTVLENVTVGG